MKVYVVSRRFSWEGLEAPLGVFSTSEKAEEFEKTFREIFSEDEEFYTYEILEYDLDEEDFE